MSLRLSETMLRLSAAELEFGDCAVRLTRDEGPLALQLHTLVSSLSVSTETQNF